MKPTIVSLFSGCGGLDAGFQNAGYEILWANDVYAEAVATYRKNIGGHISQGDITAIQAADLPKAEVIIGGPPCQSFSLLGKRRTDDERGSLVWHYLRILKEIKPRMFVFENVIGLKSARTEDGHYVLRQLLQAFADVGYEVHWKVMNAADYGIPQRRKRIFLVGFSRPKAFEFPPQTHNEPGADGLKRWLSVEDAIGDLPTPTDNGIMRYDRQPATDFQNCMRANNQLITEHILPNLSELDRLIIGHVPIGGNYQNVPDTIPSNRIKKFKETGGRTTCYGRLVPELPAYTINTHFNRPNVGCNIHYAGDRLITVREAMRLQTFPDCFTLDTSTKRGKHTIIGNSVPLLLSEVIARHLLHYL